MAKDVITDATVLWGAHDISGLTNQLSAIKAEAEELESTVFTSNGWKELSSGIKGGSFSLEGLYASPLAAGPHADIFTGGDIVVTATKTNPVVAADIAFNMNVLRAKLGDDMPVGMLHKWTIDMTAEGVIVRGIVLDTQQPLSSTADGTGQQHGAISSTQTGYGAIHVTAVDTLTSLDTIIQSDDNSDFTSATNRITFTQVTGVTSERKTVAGAVTDDWWRISSALVGTSATFVVFFGIQ